MHATVRRHRSNSRAARAEVECDLLGHLTLHRHWKISIDTAINRARLDMRRVILRHRHDHAAVGRADVESFAVPAVAGQFNHETAISRRAFHCSADTLQNHAAIYRAKIDTTV